MATAQATNEFDQLWDEAPRESSTRFLTGDFMKNADLVGHEIVITGAEIGARPVFDKKGQMTGWSDTLQQAVFQLQFVEELETWGDEAPHYRSSFPSARMMNFAKMLIAKQANYLNYLNGEEFAATHFDEEGHEIVAPVFPLPVCILSYDLEAGEILGNMAYKFVGATEANKQQLIDHQRTQAEAKLAAAQAELAASGQAPKPRPATATGSVAQRPGESVNRDAQGRPIATPKPAPKSTPRTATIHK